MSLLYSVLRNQFATVSYLLMLSVVITTTHSSHELLSTQVFRSERPSLKMKAVFLGPQMEVIVEGVPSGEPGKLGMRIISA